MLFRNNRKTAFILLYLVCVTSYLCPDIGAIETKNTDPVQQQTQIIDVTKDVKSPSIAEISLIRKEIMNVSISEIKSIFPLAEMSGASDISFMSEPVLPVRARPTVNKIIQLT